MELDIYRDQAHDKLLIVERGRNIQKLPDMDPVSLERYKFDNNVDLDCDRLPTGIDASVVLEAIMLRGYFAATFIATLKEID
ncbi:hypothetical protein G3435_20650 [Pseudomonas sp. MAFF212428]|uniref:Uncharacterized protein n=1 Tax=Pseudomonas brassicae TaxID=2708063 RepID=A0A6B3P0H8_9PSED|nr:hypothetical protein [Pseudomonas brassicae]NER61709.1 hypothetical protein [Pseudomonas brassicae]NER65417.1 hypothetical protein [Pseudomonas brassicae]